MNTIKGLKMYGDTKIDFMDEGIHLEIDGSMLNQIETITGSSYRLKFSHIVDLLENSGFEIVVKKDAKMIGTNANQGSFNGRL